MPLYEYECLDCGSLFDSLRSIKDADQPLTCNQCDGVNTKRLISLFFAQSDGRTVSGTNGGCAGCAGGACSSCSH
jgi:putative FmdB family regulatory protein